MSISACDIKVSMLFSLLLANIRILPSFFFLFRVMISSFFNYFSGYRVKLAPAIPIGAPTTLTDEMIQTSPHVALKTIKTLSM